MASFSPPRPKHIGFRVSPEEQEAIEAAAKRAGMDRSSFIRAAVLVNVEPPEINGLRNIVEGHRVSQAAATREVL